MTDAREHWCKLGKKKQVLYWKVTVSHTLLTAKRIAKDCNIWIETLCHGNWMAHTLGLVWYGIHIFISCSPLIHEQAPELLVRCSGVQNWVAHELVFWRFACLDCRVEKTGMRCGRQYATRRLASMGAGSWQKKNNIISTIIIYKRKKTDNAQRKL